MVATAASAQVVGTFRWQFAPYCNVVTLQVEQKGSLYELAGTDDQCGGDVGAAAKGSAHVNPNGTIGLALTVVRPDGLTIASSVALNPKTFSGSWQDEYANTGAFVFNPTSPASGPPRLITLTGSITTASWATGPSHITFTPFSFGRTLPAPPTKNVVGAGGPSTTNCPGSVANPTALPGQLCVYLGVRSNAVVVDLVTYSGGLGTDRSGASLYTLSSGLGQTLVGGRWAVTIP